ncbi:hypothetical protein D187_002764 [Cystobacter fuscus DSM 2262]|uniref:Uncharacterized protein n=1 Tax=Cystobacter fuscus (strain ATCC 25194 / DSM 2262 / NBRC 100088 / M29) TaxID=1242864 RepID=S9QSK6_CYSF2|nr:hypothetical protein D187_002764 [Cystobacter fuscus DSM 2262]
MPADETRTPEDVVTFVGAPRVPELVLTGRGGGGMAESDPVISSSPSSTRLLRGASDEMNEASMM